jgi:hypothetical protein
MRYLITVFCVLGWFATPVLAESNDFSKYKYDPKYQKYENSNGSVSNFKSDPLISFSKTGEGLRFESHKIPLPGENPYGRGALRTQAGIKLKF